MGIIQWGRNILMEVSSNNFVSVFSASSTVLMNATVNDLLANGNYSVRVTAFIRHRPGFHRQNYLYTAAAPTNPILDLFLRRGLLYEGDVVLQ